MPMTYYPDCKILVFFFRAWIKIKKESAPSSGLRNTFMFSCVGSQEFLIRAALKSPLFSYQLSSTGKLKSTLWAWSGTEKRDCTHNKKRQGGKTESGNFLFLHAPQSTFFYSSSPWMSFRTFSNYQMQSNRKCTREKVIQTDGILLVLLPTCKIKLSMKVFCAFPEDFVCFIYNATTKSYSSHSKNILLTNTWF